MRTQAEEYEESASWFRLTATQVGDEAARTGRSLPAEALAGGTVRDVLDGALGVTVQNLLRIAGALERLAGESFRRAHVCREYEAMLRRYQVALDTWSATPLANRSPQAPVRPRPPAPWVLP